LSLVSESRLTTRSFYDLGPPRDALLGRVLTAARAGGLDNGFRERAIPLDLGCELFRRVDRRHQAAGAECRPRNAGSSTMLATALASLSTIGRGCAGVNSPYQLAMAAGVTALGRVGTSGKFGDLILLSITSGVIVPARICPITLPSPISAIGVEPLSTAFTASPPPLNGTRTSRRPSPSSAFHVKGERHGAVT